MNLSNKHQSYMTLCRHIFTSAGIYT